MTKNISDNIQNYFSQEFQNALAMNLDEPVPGISKSLKASIPTTLAAISHKVNDGREEANRIFNLATEAAGYYSKAPDVAKLQNQEKGSSLPVDIFGNNEHKIARHIAAYSGVRPGTVEQLITLAVPVTMGLIGKNYQEKNLTGHDLHTEFTSNNNSLLDTLPEGYTLPNLEGNVSTVKEDTDKIHEADVERNKSNFVLPKWAPFAVLALVVLLLVYLSRL